MTSFDHRKADLRAQFEQQWKTLMKPWEWDPITRVIEDYLKERDEALTALVEVVADDGKELRRSKYEDALDSFGDTLSTTLGGMLTGLTDPSEGARLFREQTMVQEAGFLSSLAAPDPCRTRDALVTLEADLDKLTTDLDAKWSALQGNSRRVLDSELEATKAMTRLFDDTIKSVTPLHERIGLLLGQMLNAVATIGDDINKAIVAYAKDYAANNPGAFVNEESATDLTNISKLGAPIFALAKAVGVPAAAVAKALPFLIRDPGVVVTDNLFASLPKDGQNLVTVLSEMRKGLEYTLIGPYVARKSVVQDALPFQGTIIVSFSDTRADVVKFMEKNGVEVARKLKDLSDDDFEHWVSSQAVPGNHDDAVDIKVAMQSALQKRFDRMLSRLEKFVSDNSGVFLGTVDSRTRKLLLDPEEWDRQMTELEGLQLDQRLRVWTDTVVTIDAKTTEVWGKIQDQLADLPVDLQYAVMQRIKEVWDPLVASLRDGAGEVKSEIELSARTAGSEQRRKDLDRSAVAARLPQ